MHARTQARTTAPSISAASLLAAAALAVLLSGCSELAATPSPSATVAAATASLATGSPESPATQASSPNPSETASKPRLFLLSDASELWTVDMNGTWTGAGSVPGARALTRVGRQIAIATASGMELRDAADPSTPVKTTALEWGSGGDGAYPGALDVSDGGSVAAGLVSGDTIKIVVAAAGSSKPTLLSPAPSSPFAPAVAWLDGSRLLALSTDSRQISRLAVIDTSAHSLKLLTAIDGVRTFSLSPDRTTVAVATQAGVYVASVSDLLAGKAAVLAVPVPDTDVTWALALDATGVRLGVLSGTTAADGSVAAAHELVFELRSGTWTKLLDSPAPSAGILGQVWLE